MTERNPSNVNPQEKILIPVSEGTIIQLGPTSVSHILPLKKDLLLTLLDKDQQTTEGYLKLEMDLGENDKQPCFLQIPEKIRQIIIGALEKIEDRNKLLGSHSTPSIKKQLAIQGKVIFLTSEIESLPINIQKLWAL